MMREFVVIFGAGGTGKDLYEEIKNKYQVIAFLDNDKEKQGEIIVDEIKCYEAAKVTGMEFDFIYLASPCGFEEMKKNLIDLGIDIGKIRTDFVELNVKARQAFLIRCAEELNENKEIKDEGWCVAEAGVFRGDFAKEINRNFSQRKLYLFDTFEGFDKRDFKDEEEQSYVLAGHFNNTSVELVLGKMPNKEKCVVKKGYFPESTEGVDEVFGFVSLDFDLYKPILEGLRFFYPRMVRGGVILVDDYFTPCYPNVKKAVECYKEEMGGVYSLPIGDDRGLAIIKTNCEDRK